MQNGHRITRSLRIWFGSPRGSFDRLVPHLAPGHGWDGIPLNNHRNNNSNRRRGGGRNNNRNQGGPNQHNRIDNRSRGNAPQMLDKYKKLAQDALHNDDRVQQEYYLQFADHYFRVIADNKARQDEARTKRPDDRGGNDGDSSDDGQDNGQNRQNSRQNSGPNSNQSTARRPRSRRDEQQDGNENGDGRQQRGRYRDDDDSEGQSRRPRARTGSGSENSDNAENSRPAARNPRRSTREDSGAQSEGGEIDFAALPPAIGSSDKGADSAGDDDAPSKPAPSKPAVRKRKPRVAKVVDRDGNGDSGDDTREVAG